MKQKTDIILSKWNKLEPRKRKRLLFVFFLAAVIVTIISVHAYRINEYRKKIIRERKEYAAAIERVIAGSDAVMTEELLEEPTVTATPYYLWTDTINVTIVFTNDGFEKKSLWDRNCDIRDRYYEVKKQAEAVRDRHAPQYDRQCTKWPEGSFFDDFNPPVKQETRICITMKSEGNVYQYRPRDDSEKKCVFYVNGQETETHAPKFNVPAKYLKKDADSGSSKEKTEKPVKKQNVKHYDSESEFYPFTDPDDYDDPEDYADDADGVDFDDWDDAYDYWEDW